ncbi:hypothetical protein N1028_05930 [Herbiconiux sp. CPCC 203407]|uniref:Hydroxylase n=1 Tax=Herbiconiux oxytropis TaxID=2970915 RepID=A0AA41XC00_9MICO|nr:acyl-CoA dehydrogenase family protein [Herbiconiux oxytropis]MCS5723913.1 hypothetical protein [Herbiconiux oxytropis]MCS5725431.1 hypothetical protein [Herbiconiux oxytropis]
MTRTATERETARELVERARALQPRLRELQPAHAELGSYSEEIHEAFTEARLYDILRPERFGGLQLGIETFFDVVVEIARADPAVAWSFELGASHAYQFSSYFPEEAQTEIYATYPFVAASRAFALKSTVEKVEGGYRLSGRWDYNSGCTWSSHFMPVAPFTDASGHRRDLMFILPRTDYTVLDDWGADRTIGLHASSSNSIEVEGAFIPGHRVVPYAWKADDGSTTESVGYGFLRDPTYLGRVAAFTMAGLVTSQVGAALACLDEYERLLVNEPSASSRADSPDYQRWYGTILSDAEAAKHLFTTAIALSAEGKERWAAGGDPYTALDDVRIRLLLVRAAILAGDAIDLAFTTAGPASHSTSGSRLEKYYRDAAMYRTHIGSQFDVILASSARFMLGRPLTM